MDILDPVLSEGGGGETGESRCQGELTGVLVKNTSYALDALTRFRACATNILETWRLRHFYNSAARVAVFRSDAQSGPLGATDPGKGVSMEGLSIA